MNTNITMRCLTMEEDNVVKEIKSGETTIKFSDKDIPKTKEERDRRIRDFKLAYIRMIQSNEERKGETNEK